MDSSGVGASVVIPAPPAHSADLPAIRPIVSPVNFASVIQVSTASVIQVTTSQLGHHGSYVPLAPAPAVQTVTAPQPSPNPPKPRDPTAQLVKRKRPPKAASVNGSGANGERKRESVGVEGERKKGVTPLPMARVRAFMKADADVHTIAMDSLVAVCRATELFVEYLAKQAAAVQSKKNFVLYEDIVHVVKNTPHLHFLKGTEHSSSTRLLWPSCAACECRYCSRASPLQLSQDSQRQC
eukprot:m.175475 g.175475  ORF g.175475 m.175475 type:complete len:239 (-) comp53318_c0_seq5:264-980(-)